MDENVFYFFELDVKLKSVLVLVLLLDNNDDYYNQILVIN